MPMFSYDKISYETNLVGVLQNKFFITARRNKVLAKWAGGRLNYTGGALANYVRDIIFDYLSTPNDRKIIERIMKDFQAANIRISEDEIKQKIHAIEARIKNKLRLAHVG